jgi:hypothetical protein
MQKTRTMKTVFRRGLTAGLLTAGLLAGQGANGAEAPERREEIRNGRGAGGRRRPRPALPLRATQA